MKFIVMSVLFVASCAGLVIDSSPTAVASNDFTLAMKVCDGPMLSGVGVCRVTEGTQVDGLMHLILPDVSGRVKGGEVIIYMRSSTKSYAIPANGVVIVPMEELFGKKAWAKSDTSIGNVVASVRLVDSTGIEKVVQAEGQFWVRVLSPGYAPMPIDSGYAMWGTVCKVQYGTSGRGAVDCK
jgi:hypothetical protein